MPSRVGIMGNDHIDEKRNENPALLSCYDRRGDYRRSNRERIVQAKGAHLL